MSLKKQIIDLMRKYPDYYRSKYLVLHQLYCVNGNGYEWLNGELINVCAPVSKKYEITKKEAELLYDTNTELPGYIYPLCEYSKIVKLPHDIKKDYYVGAVETYSMIKTVQDSMKWILSYDGQIKEPKLIGEKFCSIIEANLKLIGDKEFHGTN